MGKKSDRRERRIAAAQDRDFMVNAATCWVYVATAMRYRDDAAFAEAMRQEKRKSLRAAQLVASMIALANVPHP